jgi:hypothetical protein
MNCMLTITSGTITRRTYSNKQFTSTYTPLFIKESSSVSLQIRARKCALKIIRTVRDTDTHYIMPVFQMITKSNVPTIIFTPFFSHRCVAGIRKRKWDLNVFVYFHAHDINSHVTHQPTQKHTHWSNHTKLKHVQTNTTSSRTEQQISHHLRIPSPLISYGLHAHTHQQ